MKILFVTTLSGTVNAFLIPHIKLLIDKGYEVDIACNLTNPVREELLKIGCKIHNINFERSPFKWGNYSAYKLLKKLIVNEGYTVVHTHTPIASFITRLVCINLANVKVIYTAHGFHFYKGAPMKNWIVYYPLEKILSRYTDYLITINTEDFKTAIDSKFKSKKIYHIKGVGVDITRFKPVSIDQKNSLRSNYNYKTDDFLMFYAAELNSNKNQRLLIESFSIIKSQMPNAKLLLAGSGPLTDNYKKLSRELEVEGVVEFLGLRTDVDKLLSMCDVVLSSSLREGLPVNLMEAMGCGKPIIATFNRGHVELVKHEVNGFLVKKDSVTEFSHYIKLLYDNPKMLNEMGNNSLERVKPFILDNVINEMNKLYNEILN